jgi:hypothetical protein
MFKLRLSTKFGIAKGRQTLHWSISSHQNWNFPSRSNGNTHIKKVTATRHKAQTGPQFRSLKLRGAVRYCIYFMKYRGKYGKPAIIFVSSRLVSWPLRDANSKRIHTHKSTGPHCKLRSIESRCRTVYSRWGALAALVLCCSWFSSALRK